MHIRKAIDMTYGAKSRSFDEMKGIGAIAFTNSFEAIKNVLYSTIQGLKEMTK